MTLPCARLSFLGFIAIFIGQRAGLGVPVHQHTSPSFGHSAFLYHEVVHIPSIFFFHLHPISYPNQSFISALTISSIRQTTSIKLARPATYRTALPHFPAILTIFYILYRPSLRSLRILPFSAFLFRTVQNVDASFLTLYQCCPSFVCCRSVLSHGFLRRVYF